MPAPSPTQPELDCLPQEQMCPCCIHLHCLILPWPSHTDSYTYIRIYVYILEIYLHKDSQRGRGSARPSGCIILQVHWTRRSSMVHVFTARQRMTVCIYACMQLYWLCVCVCVHWMLFNHWQRKSIEKIMQSFRMHALIIIDLLLYRGNCHTWCLHAHANSRRWSSCYTCMLL